MNTGYAIMYIYIYIEREREIHIVSFVHQLDETKRRMETIHNNKQRWMTS